MKLVRNYLRATAIRLAVLGLSLFLTFSAFAQNDWKRFDFFGLNGGLNDGASDIFIQDNQAADLLNVELTTSGNIKTRSGYSKLNSSQIAASAICTGLFYFKQSDGDEWLISIWDNDKIYKMEYAVGGAPDGTWDDITGALTFSITQNNIPSFTVAEDTLIIEDGLNTTAPYKWNGVGNAAALGGSPANATMVAYHKNMLFVAGNNTYPSRLYWSDIGNIENWSTGLSGNIDIETNDGQIIRAIVPGYDALYIFKDKSIWRLSGSDKDTFELQRLVSDKGVLGKNSISQLRGIFFMQDQTGDIDIYDGATSITKISDSVYGSLLGQNFSRIYYNQSVILNDDYYLSYALAATTTHNRNLIYDTTNKAWTKFNLAANSMCVANDGSGEEMLVFGGYDGYTYYYPNGTNDDGTAINSYWKSKQFRFEQLTTEKYLKKIRVFANQKGNYNLNLDIMADYASTGTAYSFSLASGGAVWDSAIWDTSTYADENLIIGEAECSEGINFLQFKFFNSNINEPWELKGWQSFLEISDRI